VTVAGVDVSTRQIDVVVLDTRTGRATWHPWRLPAGDLIHRIASIRDWPADSLLAGCSAVGIERPYGRHGAWQASMAAGATVTRLPAVPMRWWSPAEWRRACGLPGNASKLDVLWWASSQGCPSDWSQDAADAYCIAYATSYSYVTVSVTAEADG